ncbi:MAG: carboxypeptidase-like regulatory domain-containing protein [Terracidiphilus sp.]
MLSFAAWSCVALLVIAMMTPLGANAQMAGTGAISGTVTDSTGAVVGGATVTATLVSQNTSTTRNTTGAGDYSITPLLPGEYTLTVTAKGFEKEVQEHITVNALETVAVNIKLTVGGAQQTITVTTAPPVLETTDAQLGATMDNQMYSSLPLLMGYSGNNDQRRATDFGYLMPGVQNTYAASSSNNPTDATGAVNGGNPAGGTQEVYIDGINLPQADGVGDPRFTWTAFGVDAIDQFQVESSGYSAQYAGQGVQNYSIKSGGNQIHGSIYEYIRNTVGDAWNSSNKTPTVTGSLLPGETCSSLTPTTSTGSWCALGGIKNQEIQNEVGLVISGPIIKNKLFMFYNYGQYRNQNGPKPKLQTVPTLAMMGYSSSGAALTYADFSGYSTSTGYSIFDPETQPVPVAAGCTSSTTPVCSRTQFASNQIPIARVSGAAAYYNKFMVPLEATANQSLYGNNITAGYSNGLANWYQAGRLDYSQSEKNQISLIIAFGRQASTGFAAPPSASTVNELPPPFNTMQSYTPKTNVDILKDTYTINAHMVNQFALSYARYKSLSTTADQQSIYAPAASGLLNVPAGQSAASFPALTFTGGTDSPNNEAGYSWNLKVNNTYGATDDVQWQFGKHSVTFGGQVVEVQFNYIKNETGTPPMAYTFSNAQTEGYVAAGTANATSGSSFASYMLGAVNASAPSLSVPELGSRWLNPSLWLQDDYKVTPKLTLNIGVRWDVFPSIHEAHDQFTWLNPTGLNTITGNNGTLAFAGGAATNAPYTGLHTPSGIWYKNVAPRLGLAYALDSKTVIRASYDLNFARGDWTSGSQSGSPSTMGLVASASAPAGIAAEPEFYWDQTACGAGTTAPPALSGTNQIACGWTGSVLSPTQVVATPSLGYPAGSTLAEFGTAETNTAKNSNNGSPGYFDPYLGSRTPEYINWTFGIQRELTRNMSVTVSYVGSEGHFISVSKAIGARNNELPEAMAQLAGYTSTGAACSGTTCTAPLLGLSFTPALLAEAQALGFTPPNPYTANGGAASYYTSNKVYQYYQPFPQYSGVSDNTSFVGNENWNALEISVRERPANGLNFMVNYTWSKSIDDLGTFRVGDNDRLDRSISAASQPQNLVGTVVYQLPVGRGHWMGDNFFYRSIASDWTVSGITSYHSGLPILVAGSGCGGSSILNQCMPNVVAGQAGRTPLKYGKAASGSAISWDPNNANYIGAAANTYLNPAAFTVNVASGGTGQALNVGSGPALYVPGNAGRVAPLPGLWGESFYDVDMALKRSFPIYREWKLAFEADMSNVTNHPVYSTPGASVASGTNATYGTIGSISNSPRQTQLSVRISW